MPSTSPMYSYASWNDPQVKRILRRVVPLHQTRSSSMKERNPLVQEEHHWESILDPLPQWLRFAHYHFLHKFWVFHLTIFTVSSLLLNRTRWEFFSGYPSPCRILGGSPVLKLLALTTHPRETLKNKGYRTVGFASSIITHPPHGSSFLPVTCYDRIADREPSDKRPPQLACNFLTRLSTFQVSHLNRYVINALSI